MDKGGAKAERGYLAMRQPPRKLFSKVIWHGAPWCSTATE